MADSQVLTEVPPQLRRLVRLVVRAFYLNEHYVVMDLLAKYLCMKESDFLELLKIEGKKLRMTLGFLKKDKLIKSIQRMEQHETANGEKKSHLCYYYYINYKVFVNVVKYKLDWMRKKIEGEERRASNRTSYLCPGCNKNFSDLDVDRLMDLAQGILRQLCRCSYCGTPLEEDMPQGSGVDARSLLSRLNEQLSPILELLRETENLNLAPELLEPEPQSIAEGVLEAQQRRGMVGKGSNELHSWSTKKATDMYGEQTISVNIGTEDQLRQQPVAKERPEWMRVSTVYTDVDDGLAGPDDTTANAPSSKSTVPDSQILAELLKHEGKKQSQHQSAAGESKGSHDSEESSSDASSDEGGMEISQAAAAPSWQVPAVDDPVDMMSSEEDSDEEEFTIRLGDQLVPLNDVTPDMVAKMTQEEKHRYTQLCQQAYSDF